MPTIDLLSVAPRKTLVDSIASELIRYIAANDLRGGDRLPSERRLVEMLGASRLPLREALSVLKGLGVVEARHGKGVFVKCLDPAAVFGMLSPLLRVQAGIQVRHLFEVRLLLEPGIGTLAAESRTDEHLRTLETKIAAMGGAIDSRPRFAVHDRAFHQELATATGNPVLCVFMASLTDLLAEIHERYRDSVAFRENSLDEHQAIYEAVARRDGRAASEAIRKHLVNAQERL